MEYHEIGEMFEYEGNLLKVIKAPDCNFCFFYSYCSCKLKDSPKYCSSKIRFDNQSIRYRFVEQCKQKDMRQETEIKVDGSDDTFATKVTDIQSDEEIYSSLLDKLLTTYKAKNADYGSAFAEMFDELGIDYAYGKLREKMNRIKVLRKQPNMVENEGLEDALLDTAGYAILTLVELKKRKLNGTTNQNMKVLRNNMRFDKFERDMEKDIPDAFKECH